MTAIDKMIPYYVWFTFGFGTISIFIGIINFGMLLVTLITVKGIYIPAWVIPVVAGVVIALCTATGYLFETYTVWSRITSHTNRNVNPEFKQLCTDVDEIKKALGIKK